MNLVALSLDGSLMSTVETRLDEDEVGGFICLKFWASETQKKDFELSTIVYEPHRFVSCSIHTPQLPLYLVVLFHNFAFLVFHFKLIDLVI